MVQAVDLKNVEEKTNINPNQRFSKPTAELPPRPGDTLLKQKSSQGAIRIAQNMFRTLGSETFSNNSEVRILSGVNNGNRFIEVRPLGKSLNGSEISNRGSHRIEELDTGSFYYQYTPFNTLLPIADTVYTIEQDGSIIPSEGSDPSMVDSLFKEMFNLMIDTVNSNQLDL